MGIIRESFIIFADWDRAIRKAPDNIQLELYHLLMDYARTGEKPKDLSWQADMLFSAIETQIRGTIAKYSASVENGKKGGRPPKNKQEIEDTQENLDIQNEYPEKPSETQQNLDEPRRNLNVNDNVNVNVNDNIELVKENKKNIFKEYNRPYAYERAPFRTDAERAPYTRYYAECIDYCFNDKFKDAAYEIIDTLIEAKEQAMSEDGLKFHHKVYTFSEFVEKMAQIDCDRFRSILTQIVFNETIGNRPLYILGCLLTASETNSNKVSKEDLESFMKDHGVEYESKKNESV